MIAAYRCRLTAQMGWRGLRLPISAILPLSNESDELLVTAP